jgi:hypothetical protein
MGDLCRFIHIYNNYKNHIINKKSDKNKILNLQMAARLYKDATDSGAFV